MLGVMQMECSQRRGTEGDLNFRLLKLKFDMNFQIGRILRGRISFKKGGKKFYLGQATFEIYETFE